MGICCGIREKADPEEESEAKQSLECQTVDIVERSTPDYRELQVHWAVDSTWSFGEPRAIAAMEAALKRLSKGDKAARKRIKNQYAHAYMDASEMNLLPSRHTSEITLGQCLCDCDSVQIPEGCRYLILISSLNDIRGQKARAKSPKPNVATWQGWESTKHRLSSNLSTLQQQATRRNVTMVIALVGSWNMYSTGFYDGMLPNGKVDKAERNSSAERHDLLYEDVVHTCTQKGIKCIWIREALERVKPELTDGWHFAQSSAEDVVRVCLDGVRECIESRGSVSTGEFD